MREMFVHVITLVPQMKKKKNKFDMYIRKYNIKRSIAYAVTFFARSVYLIFFERDPFFALRSSNVQFSFIYISNRIKRI